MSKSEKDASSPNKQSGCDGDPQECAGYAAGLPLRKSFGFNPVEDATLDVLRCIGLMYGTGEAGYWDAALDHAEHSFGPLDGPVLVAKVTSLLRAIRAERRGRFSFLSNCCLHICDDELAVMTLLKASRQSNLTSLHQVACHLARSSIVRRIEMAAHGLAREQLQLAVQNCPRDQLPAAEAILSSETVH